MTVIFVAYGLGYYFFQSTIVRQLPTQLLTSITPAHFFIDLFSRLFDHADLWTEVEE